MSSDDSAAETKKETTENKPVDEKPSPPKPASKPAAAKPEEELPTFEKDIADKITAQFTDAKIAYVKPERIRINVKKENVKELAEFVRDELNYDHAESVSGVD